MTAVWIVAGVAVYLLIAFAAMVLIGKCCVVGDSQRPLSPGELFIQVSDEAHAVVRDEIEHSLANRPTY